MNTNTGNAGSALATAAKRLSATYQYPYFKHAPIGPTIAVADVRSDGRRSCGSTAPARSAMRRMLASVLQTDPTR